ncbi:ABC transporter permease [Nocardiopsis gilva YIM 90087]|uniref:ABC transporter permease n=1 Tax=Nocardiopsis gilva YIM 90087 TaxID=1235441 RepID=A0A223S7R7_9ACTN|nr:ABC transporter permease subunit [Nocardiopsis gilva]ASU84150.1 ABC transporter permease [Nocardiopsis gilva YIM 90087]
MAALTPTPAPAQPDGAAPARRRRGGTALLRWTILLVIGAYLLFPLLAMLEFSTRGPDGRTAEAWLAIGEDRQLLTAIATSLQLAALTVVGMLVLLLPTMVLVQLRLPRLHRLLEFVCLLPLTIPAIVIVVGLGPIYAWVGYLIGDTPLTLSFVYIVLVLPYAYRALDAGLRAFDLKTLAEAAQSLGASWWSVMLRVVVPNMRAAILSAALISVALVLGEFTIASLLNYPTLQVQVNNIGKRDAALSVAVSLAALMFGFLLLLALSFAGRRRKGGE